MTCKYTITIQDYGDGITPEDGLRIAQSEADAVLRRFPGALVVIADSAEGDDRFAGEWEEIAAYIDQVWDRIHRGCGFHAPTAEDAVAEWRREVEVTP